MSKKYLKIVFPIFFIFLFFKSSNISLATDFYASPIGNGDASLASPSNIETALSMMSAGDCLYLLEGEYRNYYQNYEKWAIINIDNFFSFNDPKPSELSPVVIKSYPGANVKVIGDGARSVVVEIESEDNIIIENINFEKGSIRVGNNGTANNITIRNNTFLEHLSGDNNGAIIGSGDDGLTISNNQIIGPGLGSEGVHLNTNGIYISRDLPNLKVLNNEISNVPIGIYYKHANQQMDLDMEIAYNYIHDTDRNSMQLNSNYANIHDNLLGKNNADVSVNEANGVPGGDHNIIEHNTFYLSSMILNASTQDGDPLPGAIENILKNNLFTEAPILHPYSSLAHNTTLNHNMYPLSNVVIEFGNSYGLTEWQNYYGQDIGSISNSPVFIGGEFFSTVADFALTGGSAGKNIASDGKDMGADIALVGIQNDTFDLIAPSSPTGLSVL